MVAIMQRSCSAVRLDCQAFVDAELAGLVDRQVGHVFLWRKGFNISRAASAIGRLCSSCHDGSP
jgi:hypothetical protein